MRSCQGLTFQTVILAVTGCHDYILSAQTYQCFLQGGHMFHDKNLKHLLSLFDEVTTALEWFSYDLAVSCTVSCTVCLVVSSAFAASSAVRRFT